MPTAILIGFQYAQSRRVNGILVDLHLMSKYWKSLGFKIRTLSDELTLSTDISEIMRLEHTSADILLHASDCVVHTLNELLVALEGIKDDYLVLYYTGHGSKDGLYLPSQELWTYNNIRQYMHNTTARKAMIIIDACDCGDMGLPLTMGVRGFTLLDSLKSCIRRVDWGRQELLLLTASRQEERARSIGTGSIFTVCLVRLLYRLREDRNISIGLDTIMKTLSREMHELCSSHTPMIYCSRVIPPVLPSWLYSKYDIELGERGESGGIRMRFL